MKNLSVHIVDDEKNIRRSFELILRTKSYRVKSFPDAPAFLKACGEDAPDVVFMDVMMPEMDGIEALKKLKEISPDTEVVMISGHATLSNAVEATRAGAYDFLEKPLQKDKILLTLKHLQERRSLASQYNRLQQSVSEQYRIIGESPEIQGVMKKIEKVAPTDSKVLITGESGVGKELVAYAIHQNSPRAREAFIKMNCAAIPEDLIESELFGNEKGAFTGASERRDGKFAQAHLGTLFLDEVGDMSLRVQTKVLRVLQDGEFQRVGGKEILKADVRIIAATNRNLEEMTANGEFREDLYFRLNVLPIEMPPLRARGGDVTLLTKHFLEKYCSKNNRRAPAMDKAVFNILESYHWPGNIRELQNLVERLIILSEENRIGLDDLPGHLRQANFPVNDITPGSKTLSEVREAVEKAYIEQCLAHAGGNVSQAARLLGMERTNLHKKMKSLGLR